MRDINFLIYFLFVLPVQKLAMIEDIPPYLHVGKMLRPAKHLKPLLNIKSEFSKDEKCNQCPCTNTYITFQLNDPGIYYFYFSA